MKYIVLLLCLFVFTWGENVAPNSVNFDDDDKREVVDESEDHDESTSDEDEAGDDEDEAGDDEDEAGDDEDEAGDDEGEADDDEEISEVRIVKNAPLTIEINKAKGAVVIGQQVIYTVTVLNSTEQDVSNIKLVLMASYGIDPVEVLSSATPLNEDDDVEEEGIVFGAYENLKPYQAIEYQIACDLFNFYRGEEDNFPVTTVVYFEDPTTSELVKTVAHGKHFEVVAAPYLETNVEAEEEFVDTGQALSYEIEISNIGPIDAEDVVVLITYDAQQLQIEDIEADSDVTLHAAGRIKLAAYPVLKAEDENADEQDKIVIKIKGKARMSGYASGLHVIAKVSKKQQASIAPETPKENKTKATKILTLHKAIFKERKNNNRRWDIGWKKGVLPDGFVVISVAENNKWVKKFTSQVMKNNLRPIWEVNTQLQITPNMKLQIEVYDKDLKKHDMIGNHIVTVDDKVFASEDLILTFAGVEKMYFSLCEE